MNVNIIDTAFTVELHGFSGTAVNKNWMETGFALMNKMWAEVRATNLPNKGINVWVYEERDRMFAGVELAAASDIATALERKVVKLPKYVYYKHIGPYHQLKDVSAKVFAEVKERGLTVGLPYLEIYGHWTEDETKLETELLWSLK
jgi:effector-binding domain-containing protein